MNFFRILKGIEFPKLFFVLPAYFTLQKRYQISCSEVPPTFYPFLSSTQLDEIKARYKNLTIVDNQYIEHILTHLRDKNTGTQVFRQEADRLIRVLLEHALAITDKKLVTRISPLGAYSSNELKYEDQEYCVVSILRSGNAFLPEIMKLMPGITVGQILIQRNEETAEASLFYSKLPQNIDKKKILLVDPMLGTGGSASLAIKVLKEQGVQESNILFVNLVGCEIGLKKIFSDYPQIHVITAQIDPLLIPKSKYLAPGIGDFGDRYFGTVHQQI